MILFAKNTEVKEQSVLNKKIEEMLFAIAMAVIVAMGAAKAAVVDGIVSQGEYAGRDAETLLLGFASDEEGANAEIHGSFSYKIEGELIYVALSSPTHFTNNVYGVPSEEVGSGWDSSDKKDEAGRPFDKLLASERLLFGLDTDNDGKNDVSVVIDLLAKNTDSGYDMLDLEGSDRGPDGGDINNKIYTRGLEDSTQNMYRAVFGEHDGAVLQDVASSLEYNLSKRCGDITNSPDFTSLSLGVGCSEVLTFEWSMAANQFSDFSARSILAPITHVSPSKVHMPKNFKPGCFANDSCVFIDRGVPPTAVPEPGNFVLMLAGLAGIGWLLRRKNKASKGKS